MKTEIKWAITFVVLGLVWLTLEYLVGLHTKYIAWHALLTNLVAIPAIAIYVLALREKRRELGGKLSYKQGVICGLVITVIVALLSPLGQLVFHKFINPNFFTDMIQFTVSSGKATQVEAEGFFNLNSYLMMSAVGALVMGLLTSLVVAFFVRTKQA